MKLMILDGNSVINRAYYGVRLLSTRDGVYTNAIYGFLNIMQKMQAEEKPDALCVAFDLHGPTFRHVRFDGYKATRHPMPEELAMQMPLMKDVLRAMNIPIYECQGWEADDVIGTVGKRCADEGWDCVIVTGDRDSLQLIDDHVRVKLIISKPGQTTATLYDTVLFREEYGFDPIHLIDLKSLMGDSSDNIPGVAGVGPKTAKELLYRFGTLEGVYENLTPENMKGKLYEKLESCRETAYLSYELATIRCDAPLAFQPEDALCKAPQRAELYELFSRLEFYKMIDRYHLRTAADEEKPQKDCVCEGECTAVVVADEAAAQACLASFAARVFVPVRLSGDGNLTSVQVESTMYHFRQEILQAQYHSVLERLFDGHISLITHGAKQLYRTLFALQIDAKGVVFDTEVAAYLLDASRGHYELGALTKQYLQFELTTAKTIREAGCNDADAAMLGEAASACAAIEALYEPLRDRLKQIGSDKLFEKVELPLCRVLAQVEAQGVAVDKQALSGFSAMLAQRIDACQTLIFEQAGEQFNINSPKQLGEILFGKMGLPSGKKTKTGYSTNVDVLEKLKSYPVVQAVMEYRTLTKLKSTYADGLQKVIDDTGRIHTTFQNTVTATGRLSSTDPNLQNIPVRTELGSEIRKMFVPREGFVFVDADYSQIELRVLAHIADDKTMQAAFLSGEDFHTVTAAQVFGVPVCDITPQMRRNAKAVNFGIVYGISEFSLAEDIGVSRWEAKQYIDTYLAKYHGVRSYMHDVVEQAKKDGYVTTLFGRRRYLPELHDSKYMVRMGAERMAMNTPIQGTAADIIKIAMLRVSRALEENELQARLLLQVHDELIVECPPFESMLVMQIVTDEMQNAAKLCVPLIAEAKLGNSWYEAK